MRTVTEKGHLRFVSFEPRAEGFTVFVPLEDAVTMEDDLDALTVKAEKIYKGYVERIRKILSEIEKCKKNRRPVSARQAWQVGNAIFELKESLEELSLAVDDLYSHLERDTGADRNWLGKVVTFRRYLSDMNLISESLTWRRCKSAPRRAALRIRDGVQVD